MQLHLIPNAPSAQDSDIPPVDAFLKEFPQYAFTSRLPMGQQARVLDAEALACLPVELSPCWPYKRKGKGRRNFNDTKTHTQCKRCRRVLRHDMFFQPPSMAEANNVHPICRECMKIVNASTYAERSGEWAARRLATWVYLAPRCVACGYDRHVAALDMHHLRDKDARIANLVTQFAAHMNPDKGRELLAEAEKCVAVCSNCHRLIHAGVIELPDWVEPQQYVYDDLVAAVRIGL